MVKKPPVVLETKAAHARLVEAQMYNDFYNKASMDLDVMLSSHLARNVVLVFFMITIVVFAFITKNPVFVFLSFLSLLGFFTFRKAYIPLFSKLRQRDYLNPESFKTVSLLVVTKKQKEKGEKREELLHLHIHTSASTLRVVDVLSVFLRIGLPKKNVHLVLKVLRLAVYMDLLISVSPDTTSVAHKTLVTDKDRLEKVVFGYEKIADALRSAEKHGLQIPFDAETLAPLSHVYDYIFHSGSTVPAAADTPSTKKDAFLVDELTSDVADMRDSLLSHGLVAPQESRQVGK